MGMEALVSQGYADYNDLKPYIKHTIKLGRNDFGFEEKIIELNDGSQWDYIPEDHIYELRANRFEVEILY